MTKPAKVGPSEVKSETGSGSRVRHLSKSRFQSVSICGNKRVFFSNSSLYLKRLDNHAEAITTPQCLGKMI